jgi:hypothetical protein
MLRTLVLVIVLALAASPAFAVPPLLALRAQLVGDKNVHSKDFDKITSRNVEAGLVIRLGPLFGNVDFPLARAKQMRDFQLKVGIEVPLVK